MHAAHSQRKTLLYTVADNGFYSIPPHPYMPASLHFLPQQDTVEFVPSPRETETVPTIEGNISTARITSDEMLRLKMQHAAELASVPAQLTGCSKIYSELPLTWERFSDAKMSICMLLRSFPELTHRVRAPFLTFFPFLVGEMFILALSWKVCLRTCLTKGSLAICKATMYRAPSSTASGLGN